MPPLFLWDAPVINTVSLAIQFILRSLAVSRLYSAPPSNFIIYNKPIKIKNLRYEHTAGLAESQGFEPWRTFPPYTISSRAPSTSSDNSPKSRSKTQLLYYSINYIKKSRENHDNFDLPLQKRRLQQIAAPDKLI